MVIKNLKTLKTNQRINEQQKQYEIFLKSREKQTKKIAYTKRLSQSLILLSAPKTK